MRDTLEDHVREHIAEQLRSEIRETQGILKVSLAELGDINRTLDLESKDQGLGRMSDDFTHQLKCSKAVTSQAGYLLGMQYALTFVLGPDQEETEQSSQSAVTE